MTITNWTRLRSQPIREYRTLQIREDRYRFAPTNSKADDREADFVVCDSADWALVIAITVAKQVVLVNQFRHGISEVILELPGGVMEAGETPIEAGLRELREETGYIAGDFAVLPPFLPNPAIHTAQCHVIIATGCRCESMAACDPFEGIEVELQPLSDIPKMIRRGELRHALTIAAFSIADLHNQFQ